MNGRRLARRAVNRLRRELTSRLGRKPAELVVEALRTYTLRHGRAISPGQRHVLRSCERALGLPLTPDPRPLIDDLDEDPDAA